MGKLHRFMVAFVSEDDTDGEYLLPFINGHLENIDLGDDLDADFDDVEYLESVDLAYSDDV